MKMIVGLGNIGRQYAQTRHNVGFMIVDELASKLNVTFQTSKFEAQVATAFQDGKKILLVNPATYMNDSGRAVGPLMSYYNVDPADLLVIHDDLDLPLGKVRLKQKGSAGGHNGIKSIISHVGDQHFKRVKVGIDHPQKMSVVDYVLGKFTPAEVAKFDDAKITALAAVEAWLANDDFAAVMNQYN
ncbi:aminoacyl-tRNA hydrolase [Lactiplantibacillus plantarum subsp. plantarum]|uniref:aminoacyl-tRNA hydrolase n=1 Tax=Lactiplantibacillus plantarum TaxID=1590 RepID=UPI000B5A51AD|nr:aminoacyl-tRNA hydrolase [Lactiplantibacillus plantarum]ASI64597.1 aminoacyl-tRNA hydrolase [Lactiplantibacillus plantarum subsp. plantarum]